MLQETYRIVQENGEILRGIKRAQQLNTALKALYWLVIIALSFGAYYLIQPYVNTLKGSLNDLTGSSAISDLGQ